MRKRKSGLFGLALAPVLMAAPSLLHAQSFEAAVLAELNQVRANPQAYARELRREQIVRSRYGEESEAAADEDPGAVDDAIEYLMRQRPLPPLAEDDRVAAAARDHATRQGPTGGVGHGPAGSLGRRLQGRGVYAGIEAESISYGQDTPGDVVRQLVVDAGVPSRGHRRDLLSGGFQAAGVGCGRHAEYGSMCVIDLVGAVVRR